MSRTSFKLAFVTLLILCSIPCFGQDVGLTQLESADKPSGKVSEKIRYVPFENFSEIFNKNPKGLLIPKMDFEELKKAKEAFLARQPQSPIPKLSEPAIFGRAEYQGVQNGKSADFVADFHFNVPNEKWVEIPLPSGDIGLTEVLLDNHAVGVWYKPFGGISDSEAPKTKVTKLQQRFNSSGAFRRLNTPFSPRNGYANEFLVLVKEAGNHTMKVKFVVPTVDDPSKNELTFKIPRIPMNVFSVALDKPGQFGEVDRSEGTFSTDQTAGKTQISGVLGTTDRFSLRWAPRTVPTEDVGEIPLVSPVASSPEGVVEPVIAVKPVKKIPSKVDAESFSLLSIGEGFIRSESLVQVSIARSPVGEIVFGIPSGTEFLDLRSDRLEKFSTEVVASGTRILARLRAKTQGEVNFLLVTETKMKSTSQKTELPIHWIEEAIRDKGYLGVEPRTLVELKKVEKTEGEEEGNLEFNSIDVSELPPEVSTRAIRPIILAFRYNSPYHTKPLTIDILRHLDAPILTIAIDQLQATTFLGNDNNSITCLDCKVKNNGQQFLEAKLPPESEISSAFLDNNPVKPKMKEGEETHLIPLTFAGNKAVNKESFDLRLVYQSKIATFSLHKKVSLALATFSVPIARLDWRIYTPEDYEVIPLKSRLDRTISQRNPVIFRMISQTFELLLQPPILVFAVLVFFLFVALKYLKREEPAKLEWGKVLGFSVVLVFFLFLGLTYTGGSRSAVFSTINGKLSSAPPSSGMYYKSENVAPMESREMESQDEISFSSAQKADFGSAEGKTNFDKSSSRLSKIQTKKSKPKKSSGKDRGSYPVEMKIPATANYVDLFRNIIRDGEGTVFQGVVLWQKIKKLSGYLHVMIGLGVFLIVLFLAMHSFPILSGTLFSLFIFAGIALDNWIPDVSEEFFGSFFLGVLLFVLIRTLHNLSLTYKSAAITVLLCLSVFGSAFAAESSFNPRIEQVVDVFVPYSQLGERLPKDYPYVFLNYKEYEYLKDIGVPEPDPAAWTPPYSSTFLTGNFDGTVIDDRLELSIRLEVDLLGKGFKYITFPTDGLGIRSLTLDGERVVFSHRLSASNEQNDRSQQRQNFSPETQIQNFQQQVQQFANNAPQANQNDAFYFVSPARSTSIVTDKEGRVVIEGLLVKDLFSKKESSTKVQGFKIAMPPFGMGKIHLTVPQAQCKFDVNSSVRTEIEYDDSHSKLTAVLQPSPFLQVEWREKVEEKIDVKEISIPKVPEKILEPKVFVEHEILYTLEEGVIKVTDWVKINIEQSPVGKFIFDIPEGLEVTDASDVSGTDFGEVVFPDENESRELILGLNARRMHQVEFKLEMEIETPSISGTFPIKMPWLKTVSDKGKIDRQKGYFGIEIQEGLEVDLKKTEPATVVDPSDLPDWIQGNVQAHAFKFLRRAWPEVSVTKLKNVEVSTGQIENGYAKSLVTRDGKVFTEYNLVVKNNNNQFLVIDDIATNAKILSAMVNRESVKPGLGPDGEIYIPLISSPKTTNGQKNELVPFLVAVLFEQTLNPFSSRGKFNLVLPTVSLNISKLTWRVDVDEKYFLMKGPGSFQRKRYDTPSLPQKVSLGQSLAKFSNVISQVAMGDNRRIAESSAGGLLPIMISFPTTQNSMIFSKELVFSNRPTPALQIIYGNLQSLRFFQVFLALLVAFLLSSLIFSLANQKWIKSVFAVVFLGVIFFGITLTGELFEEYVTFFPLITGSLEAGVKLGILFLIFRCFVSWKVVPIDPPKDA